MHTIYSLNCTKNNLEATLAMLKETHRDYTFTVEPIGVMTTARVKIVGTCQSSKSKAHQRDDQVALNTVIMVIDRQEYARIDAKLSKTVGEAIEELAQEKIDLYEWAKANPIEGTTPESLARVDLWNMRYKAEQAILMLGRYIEKDQANNWKQETK